MGADPTGLAVTYPANQIRAKLDWTAPTTAYDSIRVSAAPAGSGGWIIQYDSTPLTELYVYPLVDTAMDYKVEAVATGVVSSPSSVLNTKLPVQSDEWGLYLTDAITPQVTVPLGMFDNWQDLQDEVITSVKTILPMGATYPKDFPARIKYRQWNNSFQMSIPAQYVCRDGTLIDGDTVMDNLDAMTAPRLPLLLYRDAKSQVFYVVLTDLKRNPNPEGGWDLQLVFEQRQPPAYPLTSTS